MIVSYISDAVPRLLPRRGRRVRVGISLRTVFALDVPQELRDSPLQDNHFNWRYAFGLQSTIDPLQHLFFLVCGYQDPPRPLLVCVRKLLRFVLGYELVSLVQRFASSRLPSTHIETVPLFPVVPRGGPGLIDSCVNPNTHIRVSTQISDAVRGEAVSFWNHKKPEEQENLGLSG
jgi:hypothetical protein